MNKEAQEAERIVKLFLRADWTIGDRAAKACAAICVKEIINALGGEKYPSGSSLVPRDIIHWNKVLNHINDKE